MNKALIIIIAMFVIVVLVGSIAGILLYKKQGSKTVENQIVNLKSKFLINVIDYYTKQSITSTLSINGNDNLINSNEIIETDILTNTKNSIIIWGDNYYAERYDYDFNIETGLINNKKNLIIKKQEVCETYIYDNEINNTQFQVCSNLLKDLKYVKTYELKKICNPNININNKFNLDYGNLSISIECKDSELRNPSVCVGSSPAFVYAKINPVTLNCKSSTNWIGWDNCKTLVCEAGTKECKERICSENYDNDRYFCYDEKKIYKCNNVINNNQTCILSKPNPPLSLFKAYSCQDISTINNNNQVNITIDYKLINPINSDELRLYVIDRELIDNKYEHYNNGVDIGSENKEFILKYGDYT